MINPELRWYLVHAATGREDRIKHNLEQRIQTMDAADKVKAVLVPIVNEIEVRGGKKTTQSRRAFPGYIIVQMVLDEISWEVVKGTPGVINFVKSGYIPTPMSEEEVSTILDRMREEPTEVKISFKVGDSVRITNGPFKDFIAKVVSVHPEKGKVTVNLSVFGRETPTEIDMLSLEGI